MSVSDPNSNQRQLGDESHPEYGDCLLREPNDPVDTEIDKLLRSATNVKAGVVSLQLADETEVGVYISTDEKMVFLINESVPSHSIVTDPEMVKRSALLKRALEDARLAHTGEGAVDEIGALGSDGQEELWSLANRLVHSDTGEIVPVAKNIVKLFDAAVFAMLLRDPNSIEFWERYVKPATEKVLGYDNRIVKLEEYADYWGHEMTGPEVEDKYVLKFKGQSVVHALIRVYEERQAEDRSKDI
jgi:hypothetical protein